MAGLSSLFLNNQPTPRNELPQIMQPTRSIPKQEYAPEPNPPVMEAVTAKPAKSGVNYQDMGKQHQAIKAALSPDEWRAYNRPNANQSGSSIMSPTDPHWSQTNPEIQSKLTEIMLKEKYPQLFGGGQPQQQPVPQPSAAQSLAQRINAQYQR